MCDQWKVVDKSIKCIFQELAEEGKQLYCEHLSEYKEKEEELETCSGVEDPNEDDSVNKLTSSGAMKYTDHDMFRKNPPPLPPLSSVDTEEDISFFGLVHLMSSEAN